MAKATRITKLAEEGMLAREVVDNLEVEDGEAVEDSEAEALVAVVARAAGCTLEIFLGSVSGRCAK